MLESMMQKKLRARTLAQLRMHGQRPKCSARAALGKLGPVSGNDIGDNGGFLHSEGNVSTLSLETMIACMRLFFAD